MKLSYFAFAVCLAWAGLASAQEQVRCKDGTMSEAGRGACSHHGGVDKSAAAAPAAPAKPAAPKAATKPAAEGAATMVRCADGTTSEAGRGACSHHGGIAKEPPAAAKPTATAPTKTAPPAAPAGKAPPAAMVRCTDGTMSEGGQGACSHHGGIAKDAKPTATAPAGKAPPATAPPAAPAPPPAAAPAPPAAKPSASAPSTAPGAQGPPTARCKDGTLSYSKHHSGTCSNHGGVAAWLDGTQSP
jgi:hypothetical protein